MGFEGFIDKVPVERENERPVAAFSMFDLQTDQF